jgi:hypothetical protein
MLPEAVPFGDTDPPVGDVDVGRFATDQGHRRPSIHSYHLGIHKADSGHLQVLADTAAGRWSASGQSRRIAKASSGFAICSRIARRDFVEDLKKRLDVNLAAALARPAARTARGEKRARTVVRPERGTVARDFPNWRPKMTRFEAKAGVDGRVTPVETIAGRIPYAGMPAVLLHVRDISERKQLRIEPCAVRNVVHSSGRIPWTGCADR